MRTGFFEISTHSSLVFVVVSALLAQFECQKKPNRSSWRWRWCLMMMIPCGFNNSIPLQFCVFLFSRTALATEQAYVFSLALNWPVECSPFWSTGGKENIRLHILQGRSIFANFRALHVIVNDSGTTSESFPVGLYLFRHENATQTGSNMFQKCNEKTSRKRRRNRKNSH